MTPAQQNAITKAFIKESGGDFLKVKLSSANADRK